MKPSISSVPTQNPAPREAKIELFDASGALSREFLLSRGFCCTNGCKNCPYPHKP